MMIHGSMIWNFVNSMPQVYRGSPLVSLVVTCLRRPQYCGPQTEQRGRGVVEVVVEVEERGHQDGVCDGAQEHGDLQPQNDHDGGREPAEHRKDGVDDGRGIEAGGRKPYQILDLLSTLQ